MPHGIWTNTGLPGVCCPPAAPPNTASRATAAPPQRRSQRRLPIPKSVNIVHLANQPRPHLTTHSATADHSTSERRAASNFINVLTSEHVIPLAHEPKPVWSFALALWPIGNSASRG